MCVCVCVCVCARVCVCSEGYSISVGLFVILWQTSDIPVLYNVGINYYQTTGLVNGVKHSRKVLQFMVKPADHLKLGRHANYILFIPDSSYRREKTLCTGLNSRGQEGSWVLG